MKLILLSLLSAGLVAAADAGSLQEAEKSWATAITKRDFVLLDKVLSPDLVYTHSTGVIDTKDSYIGAQKKGDRRYDAVTPLETKAKQYGDTGVVTGKLRMQGKTSAGPFDDTVLLTHVWIKQGGVWRLVAHQTTKLP
jgi:ketosteroid isomerase-like protein